jgi:hypothetical protein
MEKWKEEAKAKRSAQCSNGTLNRCESIKQILQFLAGEAGCIEGHNYFHRRM